jgi:ankyrin repeat protein
MTRKRLWEMGATTCLLLAVAGIVAGFFAWRERQRRLDAELVGLLAPAIEVSYDTSIAAAERASRRCDRMLVLLRQGARVHTRGRSGWRVMHAAAATDHLLLLREALLRGEDPNVAGKKGFTPLMIATLNGRVESARVLLEHGADPMRSNDDGRTALEWGELWGGEAATPVIRLLQQHGAKE